MGRKISSLGLLVIFILLLCYGGLNYEMSVNALNLWFEKLVPSMFGVMVLVKVLFSMGILSWVAAPMGTLFSRLFRIQANCFTYVIAMVFLGFPAGAAFIDDQVQQENLTFTDGKRLIYTCSFATPGFVIMTCGSVLFQSAAIGFRLFFIQLLSGLFLLLCSRFHPIRTTSVIVQDSPFMPALIHALTDSGKTLYMIGGYLMLMMGISSVLLQFFPEMIQLPIRIIAEFSSGAMGISTLSWPQPVLLMLLSMLLSFGGLCVHMQVMCMSEHCHLSYPVYLSCRLIQALLSGGLAFLWFS